VTYCDLSSPDATCPRCGFVSKIRGAIRQCRAPVPQTCGVGCQIARSLAWFRIRDDGTCGCAEYAAELDAAGPAACWKRIEEIVSHLGEAAAKRGLLFNATAARILVARAIQAAEAEAQKSPSLPS